MDKVKGLTKGGWHPAGDKKISKDTWRSDLKGLATGKKQDPYAQAKDHQSAPLSSLKDPASFAPPPKHKDYYPNGAPPAIASNPNRSGTTTSSTVPEGPQGGWGSTVPAPSRRREQEEAEAANKPKSPPVPYRVDTSGLRTDNFPKPPVRRGDGSTTSGTNTPSQPVTPARFGVAIPPRQNSGPAPVLPPRQNEFPDEYTPAPPPPYSAQTTNPEVGILNPAAVNNLSRAGISVPGLGMGSRSPEPGLSNSPQNPQVSELQQRFARMSTGAVNSAASSAASSSVQAIAAGKKAPPPPPKKSGLVDAAREHLNSSPAPPPLPMASKPRPP